MGHDHNPARTRFKAVFDGRDAGANARFTGHFAVLDRHIEIGTDQNTLSRQVKFGQSLEAHVKIPTGWMEWSGFGGANSGKSPFDGAAHTGRLL